MYTFALRVIILAMWVYIITQGLHLVSLYWYKKWGIIINIYERISIRPHFFI